MISKKIDYEKEGSRGTLKQIMKVRSLRTISLNNYCIWKGIDNPTGIHSLKIDIQDGYINMFEYRSNGLCGAMIVDGTREQYKSAMDMVNDIIKDECNIPTKVKKNILVRISR